MVNTEMLGIAARSIDLLRGRETKECGSVCILLPACGGGLISTGGMMVDQTYPLQVLPKPQPCTKVKIAVFEHGHP